MGIKFNEDINTGTRERVGKLKLGKHEFSIENILLWRWIVFHF